MKQFLCVIGLYIFLTSCGNQAAKNKLTEEQKNVSKAVEQVVGIGKIEPESDIIQLSSPVNGIVQKILKKENDSVSIGMPILELDHQLEDAKVNQLRSEVTTQADQIRADQASTGEYEAKYNNAVLEVQRLQRLLTKGAETQQAVDDANTNLKTFQSNLKRLQAGVCVSKSKLTESKAAIYLAEVERDQKIIKSPVKGKLLEISTLIGSSIDTRQPFAQISPAGKTIAICEIDELYADKVVVGQGALVRNVGSLDTLSAGTVYFASSFLKKKSLFTDQAGEKEDRRVRTIKILLDKPYGLLLNARVECVVDISGSLKK
jgi:multidrug efflux pump subunit AcrA (membrane-fusion protein)